MKTATQKSQSLTAAAGRVGIGYISCGGTQSNGDRETAFYRAVEVLEEQCAELASLVRSIDWDDGPTRYQALRQDDLEGELFNEWARQYCEDDGDVSDAAQYLRQRFSFTY